MIEIRGTTTLVGLLGWPTSHSLSPTTQDAVRSSPSASAAARAMPGPGLRSALARAKAGTVPSGW